MQTALNMKDSLREYTKGMECEPCEILNFICSESDKAVWLLDKDMDVLWTNPLTEELFGKGFYKGECYTRILPNLKTLIQESQDKPSFSYDINGQEYSLHLYPLKDDKENHSGWVLTFTRSIRNRIKSLLNKQKKREELLCSIPLQLKHT